MKTIENQYHAAEKLMEKRFVRKDELRALLGVNSIRAVERWVKELRNKGIVVISHDSISGYKIDKGNRVNNLDLLRRAYIAQQKRALSALRVCTLYKQRIESLGISLEQLQIDEFVTATEKGLEQWQ